MAASAETAVATTNPRAPHGARRHSPAGPQRTGETTSRRRPKAAIGLDGTDATTGRRRPRAAAGPDRLTVAMFTVAAFLGVLALLAWQFRMTSGAPTKRVVLVRRVYQTRVITTVPGSGGSSVSQSVSSSGSAGALPTTKTS